MTEQTPTFWGDVWTLFLDALPQLQPELYQCLTTCVSVLAVVLLMTLVTAFSDKPDSALDLAGTAAIGALLLKSTNSLMGVGIQVVREISEQGKLLLPVMAAALAGSGSPATSAALYSGTVLFDTVLCGLITGIMIPLLYGYLCLSLGAGALGEDSLDRLANLVKWAMTWALKIILYVFTGFMAITGVVSGSTDAMAMKATKLTISGMIPVVGGILSDASEAVLVGAGTVKNATGIAGMLAVLGLWIGPFLRIGVHYLLLKATAGLCSLFGSKSSTGLVRSFSGAMGLILAMTGSCCLLLMVSLVCFVKGVG